MRFDDRTNVLTFWACVATMPIILAVLLTVTIVYSRNLSAGRQASQERAAAEAREN